MRIAGRYLLEAELGRGAAARVYRARDEKLDRTVAVKLLGAGGAIAGQARFLDEAQALAGLRHPHIIELLDFGAADGRRYLVLEFAGGGTLARWDGVGDVARVRRVAGQVLSALAAGHRLGVIHRDVKPENVLLTARDETKLSDFGLARFAGRSSQTRTGLVVGTPEFMAPELFKGKAPGPASDVYSWGCLLYALLTGKPPVTGSLQDVVSLASSGSWEMPAGATALNLALEDALALDPRARPSAASLVAFLEGLGGDAAGGLDPDSAGAPGTGAGTRTEMGTGRGAVVPGPASAGLAGPGATPAAMARVAPTRPVGSVAPARPALPGGRARSAGLAGLAVLGTAAAFHLSGPGPGPGAGSATAPAVSEAQRRQHLAQGWIERIRDADLPAWTGRLHAALHGPVPKLAKDNYSRPMFGYARGAPAAGVRDAIAAARTELGSLGGWSGDAPAVTAYLGDPQVPFTERWALYEAVKRLADVDGYLAAWGEPPAFSAGPALAALGAPADRGLDPAQAAAGAPDPPAPGPPSPGVYRLHRWPADFGVMKAVIVPDYRNPNFTENQAWVVARMVPEEHARVFAAIDLGPDPRARLGPLTVEATIANLLPPNLLRLRWNQYEFDYRAPAHRVRHASWSLDSFPGHRVVLRLPPGVLRPGRNTLTITTAPTPGLRHCLGPSIDFVGLTVGEPPAR